MTKIKKGIPYIASGFFCTLIVAMCFMVIGQFLIKNILIDRMKIKNWVTDLCVTGWGNSYTEIGVDWASRYPHKWEQTEETDADGDDNPFLDEGAAQEGSEQKRQDGLTAKLESKIKAVLSKYSAMQTTIEDYTCDFLPFGIPLQAISGGVDRVTGNRMVDAENIYIYSENGGVIVRSPFRRDITADEEAVQSIAGKITDLDDFLKEKEIPFIYVQAPVKENKYDTEYVEKYGENENNLIADCLLEKLGNKGVDCLDLRASIHEQEMDFFELFFKGDTHWNVYGGLWAAKEISQYLEQNYGMIYEEEYMQPDNYEVMSWENWYMGCDGYTVTMANLGKENMDLLIPKFETSYTLEISTLNGIPKAGSFEEVMIDYNVLRGSKYYVNAYGAFLYLKPALLQLENEMGWVPNRGKKILLLRESFASMVIPYLSMEYEYIDAITPEKFNGSIRTYIEESKPDVVIMLYTGHGTEESWYDIE